MKKIAILVIITFLVFAIILTSVPAQINYLKILSEYTHSHTKAICTEDNFCQDYEIFCEGSELVKISPITGAFIQFDTGWQDPRPQ